MVDIDFWVKNYSALMILGKTCHETISWRDFQRFQHPKISVLQTNQRSPQEFTHITSITKRTLVKKESKRLVELVSYSAKETVEDKEQGDQAHHRLLRNLQHLRKSQEYEANAHHGSIESCGWSNFTNAFSKERTKHPAGVVFP